MAVEFIVGADNRHTFSVVLGEEALAESSRSYATLGEARWAATRLLAELLDANLPNAEHVVAATRLRTTHPAVTPGIRLVSSPRIG